LKSYISVGANPCDNGTTLVMSLWSSNQSQQRQGRLNATMIKNLSLMENDDEGKYNLKKIKRKRNQ